MSDRIYLLPEQGNFYKANLHSHTTFSDGSLTKEEVKKAYKDNGYSVVAFTDHVNYQWHKELDDEGFLALAAYEVEINEHFKVPGDFSRVKTYHINLYDTKPTEFSEEKKKTILPEKRYGDYHYINEFINRMKEYGFFACYNHPYWSLQNYEDYKDLRGFWAMEIYNHGCEHDGLYGYNPQSYDEMLRTGNRLFCVSTDDNHNTYPFTHPLCDSFGGYIMIKSDKLDYDTIVSALLKGEFYSSMGPEIKELYVEDGVLHIKTSPVEKIYVLMESRNSYKKVADPGKMITEASFPLKGDETYIRVTCQDEKGLHADTNAYALKGKEPVLRAYDMRCL